MADIILFRGRDSLGPSFEQASRALSKMPRIKVLAAESAGDTGMIFIEADAKIIPQLEKSLPGWQVK
jgi:hypothetical protein